MKHDVPRDEIVSQPERLLDAGGPQKLLLEQASAEWNAGLNERRAWERLAQRVDAPFDVRRLWPFGLALAGAVAALVLIVVPWLRAVQSNVASLTPESPRGRLPSPAISVEKAPEVPLDPRDAEKAVTDDARLQRSRPLAPKPETSAVPPPAELPPGASSAAGDCAALSREGKKDEARACWIQRSLGSGLSAELALYEISRLDVQAAAWPQAVAHLREHQRRFPSGQLKGEVALTLVEVFGKSGDTAQALTESERLLNTPYGRERAEQLHWLRGNLYRAQGDYMRAQNEYEQIGPDSKFGSEALYYVAVCLEARGQREAARQAYQDYLKHPSATRADAVKRKLEQLAP